MPDIVLDAGGTAVSKTDKISALLELIFYWGQHGEQIIKNIFLLMIKANKEGSGIESVNSEHNVENLDGLASGGLLEQVTFE